MSDIFVSYAREDREFAKEMAASLEEEGWSVWWDRTIPTGRRYHKVIEEALAGAKCVIVVWSRHSVDSDWVRAEAGEGMARNILAPVAIDAARPPLVFRQLQTADLSSWTGDNAAAEFRKLVADITAIAAPAAAPAGTAAGGEETPPDAGTPRLDAATAIETAHAVAEPPADETGNGEKTPRRSRALLWGLGIGALVVVSALGIWLGGRGGRQGRAKRPVAKPEILAFEAEPSAIERGQRSKLVWRTRGAEKVSIDPDDGVDGPTVTESGEIGHGTRVVAPEKTTVYQLIAANRLGAVRQRVTVEVAERAPPAAAREPVRVVQVLNGPGGSLASHGFVTPRGLVIVFAPKSDESNYFLRWIEDGQRKEERARVVKQRNDRGMAPFFALLRPAGASTRGAPRPSLRNAGSLASGESIERYLSPNDRTPGTVKELKPNFRLGDSRFEALLTTDISGQGEAGAPVLDSQGRLVAVVVGGGGGNSISIPIETLKITFQEAF